MSEKKKHVDEENLYRFLCTKYENGGKDVDSAMMRSVTQLINLIFFKHFSSYYNNEDLRQTAMCALTNARVLTDVWREELREKYPDSVKFEKECRKHYDPSQNVMNFAYSTVRNEVHNTLVKVCREVGFDDLNPHADDEGGIAFDDPDIGIEWPMPSGYTKADLSISEKDKNWGGFKAYIEAKNRA